MRKFIEKLIITLLSTYNLILISDYEYNAIFILLALIISISLDLIDYKKIKNIIYVLFIFLAITDANFLALSPIILYNLYIDKQVTSLSIILLFFIRKNFILAFISLLSIYLSHNRYDYVRSLEKNKSIRDDLKEDTISLKKFNEQLIREREKNIEIAILEERNRISKELHDSVGHVISSSIIQVEALNAISKDENILRGLANLQNRLTDGMRDIRYSIHNIYKDSLDLEMQLKKIGKEYPNLTIDINYDIKSSLEYDLKFDILSIVKESITNVTKHSNANFIKINLSEQAKFYSISIKDNGSPTTSINSNGIGLASMDEIAKKYAGFLNIDNTNGFKLHIVFMKGE